MPNKAELLAKVEALREVSLKWYSDRYPYVRFESNVARLIEKYETQLATMPDEPPCAELEAAKRERDEWRTNALDVAEHPVVVALKAERDELLKSNAALRGALGTISRLHRLNDPSPRDTTLEMCAEAEHALEDTPTPEALERVRKEAQAEVLFQLTQDLGMFANGDGDMKRDQLERYLNEKYAELRGQR